jgi:hypothetical protein
MNAPSDSSSIIRNMIMTTNNVFTSGRVATVAIALIVAPLHSSMAQNVPIVSAEVGGYTAAVVGPSLTIAESDWVPITVTRNDSTLHAEASGSGGRYFTACNLPCTKVPEFTSTSARGFASAEPGVLRVYASDLVMALPLINGPNLPGTPNNNTVYANIVASAGFTDYVHVTSTTQPVGTAVQVPFHYGADVVSDSVLGYPQFSLHALAVGVSFIFPGLGPQNFSTENYGYSGFGVTNLPSGNFLHSLRSAEFFIAAKIGDVLPISASIGISGSPRITNGNNTNGQSNVIGQWADGRNTAGIWLGTLPAGMVITSVSGHDYSVDPTQHGAPVAPAEVTPTAAAGDARAIVSFTAPVGTGAAAITSYKVTASPGNITASGPGSPILVTGLTNGTVYTFTVTSFNATGMSTVSSASNSVTPDASIVPTVPSAPVIGVATAADGQAIVNFTTPKSDGGSGISNYVVTILPDGTHAYGSASPIVVTGLINGVDYTFTVAAGNAIGSSAESSQSNTVRPTSATPAPTPMPTPTPEPTPTPTPTTTGSSGGGGGGATSIALLLMLATICALHRLGMGNADRRNTMRKRG